MAPTTRAIFILTGGSISIQAKMTSYLIDVMFDNEKLSVADLKVGGYCGYLHSVQRKVSPIAWDY